MCVRAPCTCCRHGAGRSLARGQLARGAYLAGRSSADWLPLLETSQYVVVPLNRHWWWFARGFCHMSAITTPRATSSTQPGGGHDGFYWVCRTARQLRIGCDRISQCLFRQQCRPTCQETNAHRLHSRSHIHTMRAHRSSCCCCCGRLRHTFFLASRALRRCAAGGRCRATVRSTERLHGRVGRCAGCGGSRRDSSRRCSSNSRKVALIGPHDHRRHRCGTAATIVSKPQRREVLMHALRVATQHQQLKRMPVAAAAVQQHDPHGPRPRAQCTCGT